MGEEVTCGGGFSKQADQRQHRGDRCCGREGLHAPTGDTSIQILWNVSRIPGRQPTSTTSLGRGTHRLNGNNPEKILWLQVYTSMFCTNCTMLILSSTLTHSVNWILTLTQNPACSNACAEELFASQCCKSYHKPHHWTKLQGIMLAKRLHIVTL